MKIQITRGIYGFKQNGNVVEKTKESDPFEVDDKEGERLLDLCVAREVSTTNEASHPVDGEAGLFFDEEEDDVFGRMGKIHKGSLTGMKKEDLFQFAEALGVKKTGTKEELVKRLQQCPVWAEDGEAQDAEDMPELLAEDPD